MRCIHAVHSHADPVHETSCYHCCILLHAVRILSRLYFVPPLYTFSLQYLSMLCFPSATPLALPYYAAPFLVPLLSNPSSPLFFQTHPQDLCSRSLLASCSRLLPFHSCACKANVSPSARPPLLVLKDTHVPQLALLGALHRLVHVLALFAPADLPSHTSEPLFTPLHFHPLLLEGRCVSCHPL